MNLFRGILSLFKTPALSEGSRYSGGSYERQRVGVYRPKMRWVPKQPTWRT